MRQGSAPAAIAGTLGSPLKADRGATAGLRPSSGGQVKGPAGRCAEQRAGWHEALWVGCGRGPTVEADWYSRHHGQMRGVLDGDPAPYGAGTTSGKSCCGQDLGFCSRPAAGSCLRAKCRFQPEAQVTPGKTFYSCKAIYTTRQCRASERPHCSTAVVS